MKKTIKLIGLFTLLAIFTLGITTCEDSIDPASISYSAVDDDGNIYILEIEKDSSRSSYYPQAGDRALTTIKYISGDELFDMGRVAHVDPSGSPMLIETSEGDLLTVEVNDIRNHWEDKYGGLVSIDCTYNNSGILHDVHITFNYTKAPDDPINPGGGDTFDYTIKAEYQGSFYQYSSYGSMWKIEFLANSIKFYYFYTSNNEWKLYDASNSPYASHSHAWSVRLNYDGKYYDAIEVTEDVPPDYSITFCYFTDPNTFLVDCNSGNVFKRE